MWTLDDKGVLHCKGSPLGYLDTEQDYGNFVLELKWRWPAGKVPGKGGVLIRTTGPDKIWPKSLEARSTPRRRRFLGPGRLVSTAPRTAENAGKSPVR